MPSPLRYPRIRITPAWAGKSNPPNSPLKQIKDHPRVGGEKRRNRKSTSRRKGSPPRGRGKVWELNRAETDRRITPAWAGKRTCYYIDNTRTWDHPRVGGEKLHAVLQAEPVGGSPPRGRGKAPVCSVEPSATRITPAWAGKRSTTQILRYLYGDHPRVGGEKAERLYKQIEAGGSPPRGRGKDFLLLDRLFAQRITPAWAGKSVRGSFRGNPPEDHPRVGGEKA